MPHDPRRHWRNPMLSPWFVGLLVLAAEVDPDFLQNVRTSEPRTAKQQAGAFHVPEGFEVQLVAAEPEIPKPMNLAFDAQGRLWVSGSLEYPYAAEQEPGRDSIKILQDIQADGRARRITTFVQGLNIPIGLYPYQDGVIAYSIDRIDFWRDRDGDGLADDRQLLYGPLGKPLDTHGMQNAFRRGLDGWLYINHGFANQSTIRGQDGSEIRLHSGNTYRVRLDGSRVEQFTWGQVNPFGSQWTEGGDLVTADCHSKPLTLLLRGGYYSSFGKPHDGLGFAPELMNHHHGSTGLAGVAYYADGSWPEAYRDSLFVGNVVTSRVHRDVLTFQGATPHAAEQADFLTCDDPWFRPVDLRFGTDGALYIADFYNRIIGHYEVALDHPGRDRQRGRIWRVVYRGTGVSPDDTRARDLTTASPAQLIDTLEHPTLDRRLLAVDQLSDRCGESATALLREAAVAPDRSSTTWRRRALSRWVLLRLGRLRDADLDTAAHDTVPLARQHAMRMLAEWPTWSPLAESLALAGLADNDANVRRAAADALGQHPRPANVRPLLETLRATHVDDIALRHMLRLALRNQLRDEATLREAMQATWSVADQQQLALIMLAVPSPLAAQFMLDYLDRPADATNPADSPAELASLLQHAARYLPEGRGPQLARIARQRAQDDLAMSVLLYQTVSRALPAPHRAADSLVGTWRNELVDRLIERADRARLGWSVEAGGNPWGREMRRADDGREDSYLSSLPGGEREVSRLASRPFTIPERLSFYLCGHRGDPQTVTRTPVDPNADEPAHAPADNYVQLRLLATDRVVCRAYAPRNETAVRVDWDLRRWQGELGVIDLVDDLDAPAYAWLGVARFEPPVVDVPAEDPRQVGQWQQSAAQLMADADTLSNTPAQQAKLDTWTRQGVDWTSRAAAASARASVGGDPKWQVLAALLADNSLSPQIRAQIASQFAPGDHNLWQRLLEQLFQHLTQPQQDAVARQLVASHEGAEQLLVLIEQGRAGGRLLQRPAIRQSLQAAKVESLESRIERIVSSLPPEDDQLVALIQATRDAFRSTPAAIATGRELFVKRCSTCHQVAGQGNVVGPQLDGIGNRGLERVSEDVLAPYRNVDVAFRATILALADGRVLSGLVREKSDDRWLLVNSEGKEVTVMADEIDEQQTSPLSIMPDNFATVLTPPERNDLLAYLLSLGP
jgi:putative heme-binding domain-containing protein